MHTIEYDSQRFVSKVAAQQLYDRYRFGTLLKDGRVQLSDLETLYLLEKNKIRVVTKTKELDFDQVFSKVKHKTLNINYQTYKDLRKRGYIVKTALKFGAEFRVYDKGVKPGEDHAKWIVFPVQEKDRFTWYEFSAKNRVAHSTKKNLLIAVVDQENDVTYYQVQWLKP